MTINLSISVKIRDTSKVLQYDEGYVNFPNLSNNIIQVVLNYLDISQNITQVYYVIENIYTIWKTVLGMILGPDRESKGWA